jgi:hypothetical protein
MQAAARRGPLTVESTPPKLPTGVLTALTTTALCPATKGKDDEIEMYIYDTSWPIHPIMMFPLAGSSNCCGILILATKFM